VGDVGSRGRDVAQGSFGAWRWVGLVLVCLLCVVVLLNTEVVPLGAVRAEDLASDYGLLTWNLWATTEAVLRGESPYRTRLLFHPVGSNLAAHTLGPGFVPLGALARAARGGRSDYPLYAHRLAIAVCFGLGMLLACLALRELGASAPAALAAAVGWAFAACWRPVVANQTLGSACFLIPAVTLATLGLVRSPSAARAAGFAALVGGGVYFSEYFAAFVALAVLVLATVALASPATRRRLLACASTVGARGMALAGAVGLLVALPFVVAWAGSEGRPPRPRQVLAGGANLAGFLVPDPASTPLYRGEAASTLHSHVTRGRGPFLGFPTLLLAGLGLARGRGPRGLLLALAAAFFLLSLGPTLKVLGTSTGLPLPYAALMHVPPFQMARDPQRLAVFGVWALVCLAALGLTTLATSLARRLGPLAGRTAVLLAFAWWAAEGFSPGLRPVAFSPPAELGRMPPGGVANVPLSVTDGLAMFLQVFHGRPIVTGYVSRASERQFAHVRRLQELLDRDARLFAREMRALGVRTVVLQPGTPDAVADSLRPSGLHVVDFRDGILATQPGGRRQSASGPTGGDAARADAARSRVTSAAR
jgi:hypothetical protein